MHVEASHKTAALAGAWAALGLVPFEAWMDHHPASSVMTHNFLWLAAAAVFFFVPAYFLVIGRGNEPFDRTWFMDKQERARYGVIVRRMLVWLLSAGIVGSVWSALLSFALGASASS